MQTLFTSCDCTYDVEIFQNGDSKVIRFYDEQSEQFHAPISDLIIVRPSHGFLHLKFIEEDAILSGSLDKDYFSKKMVDDLISFVETLFPECKDVYLPYHIDFVSTVAYDEYNGEY